MAAGAAPPSESQVAASTDADAGATTTATAAATVTAPATVAGLDNGSADKTPAAKVNIRGLLVGLGFGDGGVGCVGVLV